MTHELPATPAAGKKPVGGELTVVDLLVAVAVELREHLLPLGGLGFDLGELVLEGGADLVVGRGQRLGAGDRDGRVRGGDAGHLGMRRAAKRQCGRSGER